MEVEDYYNSDSSASSPKKVVFPQFEAELSQTVIMPSMTIGAMNLEEEFASMTVTLERLSKESAGKDACIKRQEEHIAKLLKKLDKGLHAPSNRSASSDEDKKGPIEVRHLKMMVGQRKAANPKMTHLYAQ